MELSRSDPCRPRASGSRLARLGAPTRPYLRIGIAMAALLALVALVTDLRNLRARFPSASTPGGAEVARSPQDILLSTDGTPYRDSSGLFEIVPPRGWRTQVAPEDTPYNVVFLGPNRMDISVIANPVEDDRYGELLKRVKQKEIEFDANMHIEDVSFEGHHAVRRTCRLFQNQLLMIDFAENKVAHHIQFSAPPELFDDYLPAIMAVLATYRPVK